MKFNLKNIFLLISMMPLMGMAQGLTVHNGTHLVVRNSAKIVLSDGANFSNSGTFTHGNGEVLFTGNGNQEIRGTSTSSFYDLDINKSGGDVDLSANCNISHELQMNSGQFDLQNSSAYLGATGVILNETETNRIKVNNPHLNTGTISATYTLNNVSNYDPANLGIKITTNQNLGSRNVVRGHKIQYGTGTASSTESVARYYDIPGISKLESGESLTLHYWDAELNGHLEGGLKAFQWITENATDSWWTPLTNGSLNTSSNYVTPATPPYDPYFDPPNSYTYDFSDLFTLASEQNPLPIELVYFKGDCYNNFTRLEWETASETNNNVFVIERSTDAQTFEEIGRLAGAGNSNQSITYSFNDNNPPLRKTYYRLKQIDFDENFSYSNIIFVECNNIKLPQFSVYPNPFKSEINIEMSNISSEKIIIEIYNLEGKILRTYTHQNIDTKFTKTIDLRELAPAMYAVRLISGDDVKIFKINKQ